MLLEEFSTIFDRPEKVKKLREYILSLAVRGKLVPQDESDEPASVLLERIREEKERLIREKKIKKEKALPEISEYEILYELPEGWEWVRLGELGNIFNGNSINAKLKESKYSNIKDGYNYIATKDVDLQSRTINYENGIKIPYDEEKFRIAHEGAILICAEGGSAGKKIGLVKEDICFGNKLLAIELFNKTSNKYLFYLYQSIDFFEIFSSLMTGIIGGISTKNFKEILVSVPPLNEQKRIVEKVDYLMEFCDKLEAQLEKRVKYGVLSAKSALNSVSNCSSYEELEEALRFIIENFKDLTLGDGAVGELKNAILSLAVKGKLTNQDTNDENAKILINKAKKDKEKYTKENKIKRDKTLPKINYEEVSYAIPNNWDWCRLGDICYKITDGTHQTPKYTDKGKMFLSAQNIKPFKFIPYNYRTVSQEDYENYIKNTKPEYFDILLTRVGSNIGHSAVIDKKLDFAIYVSLCLIKPIKKFIDPKYICLWLNSPDGTKKSLDNILGRGTSQGNLNLNLIRGFILPIPPLNEQKRIVEKVDKLMKVCDELELKIEESKKYNELLMESILKDSLKAKEYAEA